MLRQVGPNEYIAGVSSKEFRFFAGRQKGNFWCWAASVQMVLNFHGLRVAQEDVVKKIYGLPIDAPAGPMQVLAALSGWAPDVRGRFSSIHASAFVFGPMDLINTLAYRWPLVVGLNFGSISHACVLTAVDYSFDGFGQPVFNSAIIRDPWPKNPSRQVVPWMQFMNGIMFWAKVYVQRM